MPLEKYSSQPASLEAGNMHFTAKRSIQIWKRFLVLWTVSSTNYFAYGIMNLALILFASRLTRSPLLVSGVSFAMIVPAFLLSLPAGAIVDRSDRRTVLIVTTAIRIATFALSSLASLLGFVSLPLLYILACILGTTETVEEPALAAALPLIVPKAKLAQANTLLVGAQNIIGLLTNPLGALVASISIVLTLSIGGFNSVIAFSMLLCLCVKLRSPSDDTHIFIDKMQTTAKCGEPASQRAMKHMGWLWADVFEGLHYLWNDHLLLAIGLMAGAINACWTGYLVVMVLYAVVPGPLGLSAPTYGLLLTSIGLGSLVGTLLTMSVESWLGKRWAIGLNILGNGLMFLTPALTNNFWLIGATMLFGGMVSPMWTIATATLQGRSVPTALQGRVNASYRFLSIGTSAIGPLLGGLFAQFFGLSATFLLLGILTWLQLIPFFWVITEHAMIRHSQE